MIELPEACVLASQINKTVNKKKIRRIVAGYTPHKFAWYAGDPQNYPDLLAGKTMGYAASYGGLVEVQVENAVMLFGDGVVLKYHEKNEPCPQKHQLLIEFDDSTALSCIVQMYGGLWCFEKGTFKNPYHQQGKEKPSPYSEDFDCDYFESLISSPQNSKMSLKALLATEQRIPGLGNGVLQDILFNAKLHPRRKSNTLAERDKQLLFNSIKTTLSDMAARGGRDTEKDLLGNLGGYITKLSKNTVHRPCLICESYITKEAYMGGSIYYCPTCQSM